MGAVGQALAVLPVPLRSQALRAQRPLRLPPLGRNVVERDPSGSSLSLLELSRPKSGTLADKPADEVEDEVDRKLDQVEKRIRKNGENSTDGKQGDECFETVHADARGDAQSWCPAACPYRVEDTHSDGFCNFQCVATHEQCVEQNPRAGVTDKTQGICRRCAVWGCAKCARDGADHCAECQGDWELSTSGECVWRYRWIVQPFLFVLFVLVAILVYWFLDISFRPTTNARGLTRGFLHRSWSKIRQVALTPQEALARRQEQETFRESLPEPAPAEQHLNRQARQESVAEAAERTMWPLSTNLMREDVAGPGLLLHFRFQFAIIMWAFAVAIAWAVLGLIVDEDLLFKLGTQEATTPHMYCVLVAWGFRRTIELRVERLSFIFSLYVISCILAILFAFSQQRTYDELDDKEATMKDYAALCSGLPRQGGDELVEEELGDLIARETGAKVIGVSVPWDVSQDADEPLADALAESMDTMKQALKARSTKITDSALVGSTTQTSLPGDAADADATAQESSACGPRRFLLQAEKKALKFVFQKPREERQLEKVPEVLRGLKSSGFAFVVFETEGIRDAAVEAVKERGGLQYKGCTIFLKDSTSEPATVIWRNFSTWDQWRLFRRVVAGCVCILGVLLFYSIVFFVPAAHMTLYFFPKELDATAAESSWVQISEIILGLVIVVGNQINYFCCALVAEKVGFRQTDTREAAYMIWYLLACLIAMCLDFCLQYDLTFRKLGKDHIRTYDGGTFNDELSFRQGFEAYAMQKDLGSFLWHYQIMNAVSYLPEPLALIFLPYHIGKSLVRSHPEATGVDAESLLMCLPTDLGRYADVLLNVLIAILVFLFPSGYTFQMFALLALLNAYIYCYDHVRILQYTLQCAYANRTIEDAAQMLLAIPCGLLLACYIFKSRCMAHNFPEVEAELHTAEELQCLKGPVIFWHCLVALLCHCAVHWFVLLFVLPHFRSTQKKMTGTHEPYRKASMRIPCSWFSANDVHCLRSRYIYEHKPPAGFCFVGKEHLMEYSEAAQCYFTAAEPEMDDERAMGHVFSEVADVLASSLPFRGTGSATNEASDTSTKHEEQQ